MKKLIFSLVLAVIGLSVTSCVIEEGDTPPRETQAGKVIFNYSEQFISNNVVLADIAIKINKFSETPAEQKNAIEDRFFPLYKPRATGNTWNMWNNNYVVTTDGKSLETIGAKWRVSQYNDFFVINIECTGSKQWKVTSQMSTDGQITGYSDLTIKALLPEITSGAALFDYSVSGSGNYNAYSDNSISVSCTIKDPMKFVLANQQSYYQVNGRFYAAGGKIEMVVSYIEDAEKRDLIIADLSSSVGTNIVNRITYKGVTQVW